MSKTNVDVLADKQRREATAWAAGTMTNRGAALYAVPGGGWDVEMPDGSWRTAKDWRELCALAAFEAKP